MSPAVYVRRAHTWLAAALLALVPTHARAQAIGSVAEDRARLNEILGQRATAAADSGIWLRLVQPDIRVVRNSAIPYSLNDGALWAGRGFSASVTAGVSGGYERGHFGLDAQIAPTFAFSQNLPFDFFPGRAPGRSFYSSPWHLDAETGSADLPLRFGDAPLRVIDAGESSIAARAFNVRGGLTSASAWWGPAIRNTLVLSNNAPGIPRAFVGTATPLRTKAGSFAAEMLLGTLTESRFFDTVSANNYRGVNAIRIAYHPPQSDNFTVGIARAVYTPETRTLPTLRTAVNVLRWRPPALEGDTAAADQITSLFWRWIFPASGFEVYGEFAREELPRSFADLLQTPDNTGAYTLGFQLAFAHDTTGRLWRIQSEVTTLGQNIVDPAHPPVDFYTGRVAVQGYTQRGQIIGAPIGPGSDAQFIGIDRMVSGWQLGGFVGRTRWEDNALYRQQFTTFFSHDVTIYSGLRAALRLPRYDVAGELSVGRRFNYLFQNGFSNPEQLGTVRVQNVTVALRLSPR